MEVFQELDVLLVLGRSAQLHQLISKGVVDPPVSQEVHQVVVQGLKIHSDEDVTSERDSYRTQSPAALLAPLCALLIGLRPLKSHPVQRVCAERVAGLLPIGVALRLEADLADGKDIALLLSFAVTHLQNGKSSIFYSTQTVRPKMADVAAAVSVRHPGTCKRMQPVRLPGPQGNGSQTPGNVLLPVLLLQQQSWVLTQCPAVKKVMSL